MAKGIELLGRRKEGPLLQRVISDRGVLESRARLRENYEKRENKREGS